MDDFLFVLRTFAVTVVLFLLMQFRVGSRTIEQHSVAYLHSSSFVESLQNVSDGAVHIVHIASRKISALFTHLPSVSAPEIPGTRETRRRVGKRVEARKALSHEAVVASDAPSAKVADKPVAAAAPASDEDEAHKTGSFRTFFDVKTVHDADKNNN